MLLLSLSPIRLLIAFRWGRTICSTALVASLCISAVALSSLLWYDFSAVSASLLFSQFNLLAYGLVCFYELFRTSYTDVIQEVELQDAYPDESIQTLRQPC